MSVWSRRLLPIFLSACLVSASLLCPGGARAQDNAADTASAKEHYARGTSFYDLGHYDDAIKEFEIAYQLKKDAAILFNLAQSHRLAGSNDRALALYRTYLRNWPKGPNRAEAEKQIKALEQKLATTSPPSGTAPPPANTTTPPPANNTPPPANNTPPPGTEPTGAVPPGSTTTLPPEYPPPPGYTPPPPGYTPPPPAASDQSDPSDPGRKFRIAGYAAAGTGALLTAIGIYEFTRAAAASDDIEKAAKAGDSFDPAVQQRGHSAETAQKWLYALGGLAIAGGVGLFFYGQHVTAAETTTWRVSLAPTLAPNQGGATLRVNF